MRPPRAPRPRFQVHRGRVEALALWFDPALLGEAQARRRVLAEWTPGSAVYALEGGWLLRWPSARRLECASAPGLPFTGVDGVLLAVPLSASERERLAPAPGSVVWMRAGQLQVRGLESSKRVEVASWLEVSPWQVVAVEGLGAPPPPVAAPETVAPPTRERFGLGAPAAEAVAMRARLEGRVVPRDTPPRPGLLERLKAWWKGVSRRPGTETVEGQARAVPAQATATPARPSFLGRVLSRLRAVLRSSGEEGQVSTREASPSRGARAALPKPQGPSLLSRLTHWLATSTPLGSLLGQRKAEYVRKLFDLFDEGNLDEALRYAIPLNKGELTEQARVSLGLPGPRESLALQPRRQGGAATIFGGGQEVYRALRERYREAFRKLEREGRIEEAAFILAELLGELEEAVSLLERHGRLKLAAELAEGRGLAPELVVRLWMLARDVRRAVEVVRRTGAFAPAVQRLDRTHPEEARVLRLLWGDVLAEAGDWVHAVDVVWPIPEARRLTRAWLEQGLEVGGVGGARLLARLVVAFPEHFTETRTRVLALLESELEGDAAARAAFVQALAGELVRTPSPEGSVLLRPAVRALLLDQAAGESPLEPADLKRLVRLTGDPLLRTDLPLLPPATARVQEPSVQPPREHRLEPGEGGPWPIHDAVSLPRGRMLVALGEAGARIVTLDGRCVAHFDVPAFSLVLSHQEDRALALARRGSLQRVSRLDLVRKRAEPWCDTRVDAFASVYDGQRWFLAVEDTVMAVDVLAREPRALWRVTGVGAPVVRLVAEASAMSFAMLSAQGEVERWSYTLPELTLRSRHSLPSQVHESPYSFGLSATGELWARVGVALLRGAPFRDPLGPPPAAMEFSRWVLRDRWVAMLDRRPEGERVWLVERTTQRTCADLLFLGEQPVDARLLERELVLFDDSGRLVRVELATGEVRRVVLR